MSGARQVLNWLGLLLLLVIVIPFVIYAVPGVIGAEGSYVVLSGSMEPSISTGDVIVVDEVDPTAVEEGDVITYLRTDAETPTTHRVVGITEQGDETAFITQGDANDEPDASPVLASQVMGQVTFTIPYIGYVIEFVNTPMGFIALVIVPFVLLLLTELRSILASKNSATDETASAEESVSSSDDPESSDHRSTDSDTATAANGTASESETGDRADDVDESNTIAVTRSDLRLSLGILSGTTVYALWVLYNVQVPWSFSVAFGSGIGLVVVGTIYYAAGSDDTMESESRSDREPVADPPSEDPSGVDAVARTDGAIELASEELSGTEFGEQSGPEGAHE